MESLVKFSCDITSTDFDIPLSLEIWLDDQCIFEKYHVRQPITFVHEFPDTDAEHQLRFVMKNKRAEHTRIDQDGNIVSDACLKISSVCFDEIMLEHMFTELAEYTHDFNGTGPATQDKFFDTFGCNGTVTLNFTTPVYLWLLENL